MQETVEYVVCDPESVDAVILLRTTDKEEAEALARSVNGISAICGLSGRVTVQPATKNVLEV